MKLSDKKFQGRMTRIADSRRLSSAQKAELFGVLRPIERVAQMIGQLTSEAVRSMVQKLMAEGKSSEQILEEVAATGLAGDMSVGDSAEKVLGIINEMSKSGASPDDPAGTSRKPANLHRDSLSQELIEGTGKIGQVLPPGQLAAPQPPASQPDDAVGADSETSELEDPLPALVDSIIQDMQQLKTRLENGEAMPDGLSLEPADDAGFIPDGMESKVAGAGGPNEEDKDDIKPDDYLLLLERDMAKTSLEQLQSPKPGESVDQYKDRLTKSWPEIVSLLAQTGRPDASSIPSDSYINALAKRYEGVIKAREDSADVDPPDVRQELQRNVDERLKRERELLTKPGEDPDVSELLKIVKRKEDPFPEPRKYKIPLEDQSGGLEPVRTYKYKIEYGDGRPPEVISAVEYAALYNSKDKGGAVSAEEIAIDGIEMVRLFNKEISAYEVRPYEEYMAMPQSAKSKYEVVGKFYEQALVDTLYKGGRYRRLVLPKTEVAVLKNKSTREVVQIPKSEYDPSGPPPTGRGIYDWDEWVLTGYDFKEQSVIDDLVPTYMIDKGTFGTRSWDDTFEENIRDERIESANSRRSFIKYLMDYRGYSLEQAKAIANRDVRDRSKPFSDDDDTTASPASPSGADKKPPLDITELDIERGSVKLNKIPWDFVKLVLRAQSAAPGMAPIIVRDDVAGDFTPRDYMGTMPPDMVGAKFKINDLEKFNDLLLTNDFSKMWSSVVKKLEEDSRAEVTELQSEYAGQIGLGSVPKVPNSPRGTKYLDKAIGPILDKMIERRKELEASGMSPARQRQVWQEELKGFKKTNPDGTVEVVYPFSAELPLLSDLDITKPSSGWDDRQEFENKVKDTVAEANRLLSSGELRPDLLEKALAMYPAIATNSKSYGDLKNSKERQIWELANILGPSVGKVDNKLVDEVANRVNKQFYDRQRAEYSKPVEAGPETYDIPLNLLPLWYREQRGINLDQLAKMNSKQLEAFASTVNRAAEDLLTSGNLEPGPLFASEAVDKISEAVERLENVVKANKQREDAVTEYMSLNPQLSRDEAAAKFGMPPPSMRFARRVLRDVIADFYPEARELFADSVRDDLLMEDVDRLLAFAKRKIAEFRSIADAPFSGSAVKPIVRRPGDPGSGGGSSPPLKADMDEFNVLKSTPWLAAMLGIKKGDIDKYNPKSESPKTIPSGAAGIPQATSLSSIIVGMEQARNALLNDEIDSSGFDPILKLALSDKNAAAIEKANAGIDTAQALELGLSALDKAQLASENEKVRGVAIRKLGDALFNKAMAELSKSPSTQGAVARYVRGVSVVEDFIRLFKTPLEVSRITDAAIRRAKLGETKEMLKAKQDIGITRLSDIIPISEYSNENREFVRGISSGGGIEGLRAAWASHKDTEELARLRDIMKDAYQAITGADTNKKASKIAVDITSIADAAAFYEKKAGVSVDASIIEKLAAGLDDVDLSAVAIDQAKCVKLASSREYGDLALLALVDYIHSYGDRRNDVLEHGAVNLLTAAVAAIPELHKVAKNMELPEIEGQPSDAVDLDDPSDKAADGLEIANPAHITFEMSEPRMLGRYMTVDVNWDPDCDACKGLNQFAMEQRIKSYIKGLESDKNHSDLGFLGKVVVDELDLDAGTASVHFATDKGGVTPLATTSA